MKSAFVIEGISKGGFWDQNSQCFRGLLFATYYNLFEAAEVELIESTKEDWCKITENLC